MKILMTGATGFIGQEIVRQLLRQNHHLVILTRNVEKARKKFSFPFEFYEWSPTQSTPPAAAFKDIDAVIHLAGESLAEKRWSDKQKKKIEDSRLIGTRHLVQGIQSYCTKPLHVFISSSAIGYYGTSTGPENTFDETSAPGSGFLPKLCAAWEQAALECKNTSRTVIVRTGVVLDHDGGALQKLMPIFKMGLGGPIGSGKAGFSWIHRQDLAKIFVTALTDSHLKGVYNGVAPNAVSNAAFTKAFASALQKPAFFPVPPFALKIAFGEMSQIVLDSQYVKPAGLLKTGFAFDFPEIQDALNHICGHAAKEPGKKKRPCERFRVMQWLPQPIEDVFPFFSNPNNLEEITPKSLRFQVLKINAPQNQNAELPSTQNLTTIDYKLKIHGIPARWTSLILDWNPPHQFVDTQIRGPYAIWHHTHDFFSYAGGTVVCDTVLYRLPLGLIGALFGGAFVKRDVREIFKYRQAVLEQKFKPD